MTLVGGEGRSGAVAGRAEDGLDSGRRVGGCELLRFEVGGAVGRGRLWGRLLITDAADGTSRKRTCHDATGLAGESREVVLKRKDGRCATSGHPRCLATICVVEASERIETRLEVTMDGWMRAQSAVMVADGEDMAESPGEDRGWWMRKPEVGEMGGVAVANADDTDGRMDGDSRRSDDCERRAGGQASGK